MSKRMLFLVAGESASVSGRGPREREESGRGPRERNQCGAYAVAHAVAHAARLWCRRLWLASRHPTGFTALLLCNSVSNILKYPETLNPEISSSILKYPQISSNILSARGP